MTHDNELWRWAAIALAAIVVVAIAGGAAYLLQSRSPDSADLVIYAYDSFESWGLGPETSAIFEDMYSVDVRIVKCGDVGSLIGRLDAEKDHPKADIALGIDNSMSHIAKRLGLLSPYRPENLSRASPDLVFDPDLHLVPYDYGYIAIICDGVQMEDLSLPVPRTLQDLADPVYRGHIMMIHPATSSTGSSFLVWAASVMGDALGDFLDDLSENVGGKVVGTWDSMYAAFVAGEVPIAISYGLDTASEMLWSGTSRTVTVVPDDHGYRQIEGAGIVKGAKHEDLARKYMEFLLSDDFQVRVGYNVMLPVVPGTAIDPVFIEHGEFATDHMESDQTAIAEGFDGWLEEWERAF